MHHCFLCGNGTRVCHALTSDFLTTCNVYLNILVPGTTIQPPLGDLKRVVCGSCRDLLRRKTSESVAVDREDADVTPSKKRRLFLENSGDGRRARIREKGQLISCDSWRGRNNETLHSILRSFNGSTLAEGGKNKLTTAVKQYKCVTGVGDAAASIERKRRATEEETRFLEERMAEEDGMCQFRVGDHVSDSGNTMPGFCEPPAIGGRITERSILDGHVSYDVKFSVDKRTRKAVSEGRLSAEVRPGRLRNKYCGQVPLTHQGAYSAAIDSAQRLRRLSGEQQLKLKQTEKDTKASEEKHRRETASLSMALNVAEARSRRKFSHLDRRIQMMTAEQSKAVKSAVCSNEKEHFVLIRAEKKKRVELHKQLSDELEELRRQHEATKADTSTLVQEAAVAAEATVRNEVTAVLSLLTDKNKALQEQVEQVRNLSLPPPLSFPFARLG